MGLTVPRGLLGTERRDLCLSNMPSVPLFAAWSLLSGVEYPWGFRTCARMTGAKHST